MARIRRVIRAVIAMAALVMLPANALASAIIVDNFEDGTTQNWIIGAGPGGGGAHPAPPQNVANGGPSGAGDNYLLLTAVGGVAAGSRLSVLNLDQWALDYIASGITQIEMDLNNLGQTELALRLLFEDPMFGPPTNSAFSADPILVPAGSGWVHVVFPVAPAALIANLGTAEGALMNTTALRIFHSLADAVPGPSVVASLGVDNITAIAPEAVPEPITLLLFGTGCLAVIAKLRVQRKKTHRRPPHA
jgi:hypothetical protein